MTIERFSLSSVAFSGIFLNLHNDSHIPKQNVLLSIFSVTATNCNDIFINEINLKRDIKYSILCNSYPTQMIITLLKTYNFDEAWDISSAFDCSCGDRFFSSTKFLQRAYLTASLMMVEQLK